MAQERLHVVPHGDGWAVKWEGKNDATSTHATQKEAIDSARDVAQAHEADLVVHRSDGTFRKVYSIVGEDDMNNRSNDTNGGRERHLATSDLLSVGTRISWGSVLAGTAVALTTMILMGVLATAAGLSMPDKMSNRGYFIGAMICSIVTVLGALFLGGLVVSRLTAGEDKTEAVTYGVVLWGTLFVFVALLTATGANIGVNALAARNEARGALPDDNFFTNMKLNEDQVKAIRDRYNESAPRIDPSAAAWWTFASMLLSLGASIAGAITGAGPTLFIRQIRERRGVPGAAGSNQSQSQLQTAGR